MRRKNDTPEYTARHAAGTPTTTEEASTTTEFPTVSEPTIPIVSELIPPVVEEDSERPKKRWSLFGWLKKKEPLPIEETHMAWGAYEARVRCLNEIMLNIESFMQNGTRNRVDK